ncbi:hypothetical protein TTHERM_00277350 (macronuclear) [Tetrahymena thermophila SB210]|uniref:Uncharacterized protein n=1 Tax=Tetrahymena thermophila (strain SB210) TaxID=312017 RepID=I7M8D1_TETTS|nr:hypothetical protein TTHERM_00277350 [Tetrahymena thermophila SB210]EAR97850.2 hypothetical protein TTHERM_00277350 [Tetrahymena thermophila SB210]|eukprot:XP_001018095.2 hypothetical protein TTHERM_00277350 [Tetrahymena thermophila SB210]
MEEQILQKENISTVNEKEKIPVEGILSENISTNRNLINQTESQNLSTSFYKISKSNRYSVSENREIIEENLQLLQSKMKRNNNIPRPKNSEIIKRDKDNIQKTIGTHKAAHKFNQGSTIEQGDSDNKVFIQNGNVKRHHSFSKGRGKENSVSQNCQEKSNASSSLNQQRKTAEICPPFQEQENIQNLKHQEINQISYKHCKKDTIFENNQYKFVRQKAVIAQNKENLEKNLIKLNNIKMAEQEKGAIIMRGLENKQNYQISKIHNSQQTHLVKQMGNSKQHSYLLKSGNNPNRNNLSKNTNNNSYDNQMINSFNNDLNVLNECQEFSQASTDSDKIQSNQNYPTVKNQIQTRGRSTRKANLNQDITQEDSKIYQISKNSIYLDRNKTERDELTNQMFSKDIDNQQIGSVSNISFSVTLTEQIREKKNKELFEENRAHLLTEEDQITKKEWIKLHLEGNKIKNLPSNIEEEYNRIQKLTQKNEIALQEYVAIRKKIISIQSKNRIPSALR